MGSGPFNAHSRGGRGRGLDAMGRAARRWHHRRSNRPMECPMPQPNDLSRSLVALDQDSTLVAVIEMGQASWLVAAIVPGINRHPLKKIATDQEQLRQVLRRWAKEAETAGRLAGATRPRPQEPRIRLDRRATSVSQRTTARGDRKAFPGAWPGQHRQRPVSRPRCRGKATHQGGPGRTAHPPTLCRLGRRAALKLRSH